MVACVPATLCCTPKAASQASTTGSTPNEEFGRSSAILTLGTAPAYENLAKYVAVGAPQGDGQAGDGRVYVFSTDGGDISALSLGRFGMDPSCSVQPIPPFSRVEDLCE